ncbi:hypothetical protein OGY35_23915 [Citrobacter sp. Ct235]|uniref:hypothetical protein n=1 Tax=Citrobacter sp. Ct235 TaxID=2985157 RepID=UPI002576F9D8|nr:hypothetical protein [Citrobacter sp. Ct235]MDM2738403.1 hypothetical protein [Citrobacter sp. Ct235]
MKCFLHFTQGTTIITNEETSGYESSRKDKLLAAEIILPNGNNNINIFIDEHNVVLRYKYITLSPTMGTLQIGKKTKINLINYQSERKHIKYLNELYKELIDGAMDLPYRVQELLRKIEE